MTKELLFSVTKKDLEISYFSGTGGGGQHRNKHQNCVRMYHKDSGARSTGQASKERKSNLKKAFNNLVESQKFKIWLNEKVYEETNQINIEKEVKDSMSSDNIRIEGKDENNKWKEIK
jgi:protein subunit release factor B